MSFERKKVLRLVILSLLIFSVLLSLFLIVLLLIFLFRWSVKGQIMDTNTNKYQYHRFNPITDETTVGFVDLFQTIDDGDFLTYQNGDFVVMISNTGVEGIEDYRCYGTCFCDTNNNRRNLAGVATKTSLFTLVAALTSVIAIQLASHTFDEECHDTLTNECLETNIQSEVNECVPYHEAEIINMFTREKKTVEEIEKEEAQDHVKLTTYQCTANCLNNDLNPKFMKDGKFDISKQVLLRHEEREIKNCEVHELTTEVKMVSDVIGVAYEETGLKEQLMAFPASENNAAILFIVKNLFPYCSVLDIVSGDEDGFSFCRAMKYDSVAEIPLDTVYSKNLNPSAKCIQKGVVEKVFPGDKKKFEEENPTD